MVYSFNDIRCKEIINVRNGCRIGFPDDIEFENCTAKICRLIVYGKARFFGLFGREEDICIKWCDIEVIGEDTILKYAVFYIVPRAVILGKAGAE